METKRITHPVDLLALCVVALSVVALVLFFVFSGITSGSIQL